MRLFVGPCSARPVTPQLSCLHPRESACPRQAESKIRFPGHTTRPTRRPQLSLRESGSTAKGTQKQIHKPGLGAERAGFVCVCLFPPPIRSKGRRGMFPSSLHQAPKTRPGRADLERILTLCRPLLFSPGPCRLRSERGVPAGSACSPETEEEEEEESIFPSTLSGAGSAPTPSPLGRLPSAGASPDAKCSAVTAAVKGLPRKVNQQVQPQNKVVFTCRLTQGPALLQWDPIPPGTVPLLSCPRSEPAPGLLSESDGVPPWTRSGF